MTTTIEQQMTAIRQARDILNGGKAPRKTEAQHLAPLLTEAICTLSHVQQPAAAKGRERA